MRSRACTSMTVAFADTSLSKRTAVTVVPVTVGRDAYVGDLALDARVERCTVEDDAFDVNRDRHPLHGAADVGLDRELVEDPAALVRVSRSGEHADAVQGEHARDTCEQPGFVLGNDHEARFHRPGCAAAARRGALAARR